MKTPFKTPAGYVAPLRSRSAIVAFLLDRVKSNSRPGYGLFTYNVKLWRLKTDWPDVLKTAREAEILPCSSDRYLAACAARWEEKRETAFEIGTQEAAERVTGDDTNRMLWDDSGACAEWEFAGRSGGWLVLTEFDGVKFARAIRAACMDQNDWAAEFFAEQPYRYLRRLYRFLIQCDHDFKRPETEVEYLAADFFFCNCVRDIETDEQAAERIARENAEAAERAHWEARDTVTA